MGFRYIQIILVIFLGIESLFNVWEGSWLLKFMFLVVVVANIVLHKRNYKFKKSFTRVINSVNVVILEYGKEDKKLSLSKNYKNVFGIDKDINILEDFYEFIDKKDRDYIRNFLKEVINREIKDDFILEFQINNSNEEVIVLECSGKGEINNKEFVISATILDITEKVKLDNMLRKSEKKYKMALEGSKDIMFYINLKEKTITLDNKISSLLGLEWKRELVFDLEEWFNYIIEDEREKVKNKFYEFLNSNSKYLNIEYRAVTSYKKELWLKIRGKRINDEGDYIYGSINDDTDRKEKEIKINYLSYYDEVTGIPNRHYFMEKAEKMKEVSLLNKKYFVIIFIDLDNFKLINDTYGHATGDSVLRLFCNKVNKRLEYLNKNWFLSRFGGDEFIISIENVDKKEEIIDIVKNIIEESNIPISMNKKDIYNTVSIGVSMGKSIGDTIQSLLKKADIAMYNAKATGKNKYMIFDEKLAYDIDRELKLDSYIRKSIENNEIYFLMQPKYYIKSREIQGFEFLARWNSEELGIVSPSEFIPTAENNGFIVEIGKYLIKNSFKKCKLINELSSKKLKVSINLSEVQLRDEELIDFIKKSIKEEDIDPQSIEFEVTESIIMESIKRNIGALGELKKMGFSVALDDFGTGYSSLNYLKNLPIDTVKIDKSFIDDIGKDFKGENIIKKIIELAHLMNLEVVAEGVENKEQFEFLSEANCDIIQGYYLGKPKTFEEVKEIIK